MVADIIPNPLAQPLVDSIKIARARAEENHNLRTTLAAAVDLLRERDAQLDASRLAVDNLRAQLRACVSGRTIAKERQEMETEEPFIP